MTQPTRRFDSGPSGLLLSLAAALAATLAACGGSGGGSSAPPPVPATFTVHYHRPAADYAGWSVKPTVGAVETTAPSSGTDAFGATFSLTLQAGATSLAFGLANGSATDPAGPYTVDVSGTAREAWIFQGSGRVLAAKPAVLPGANQVVVYYKRADTDYSGWGLHTWGERVTNTVWTVPVQQGAVDPVLGAAFVLDVKSGQPLGNCPAGAICVIAHKGDTKDPGPDMSFDPATTGNLIFLLSGSAVITSYPRQPGAVDIAGASAHLLRRDVVVFKMADADAAAATQFELRYSPQNDVKVVAGDVVGGQVIPLVTAATLPADVAAKVPHLAQRACEPLAGKSCLALSIDGANLAALKQALRGQVVAVARKADGKPVVATLVQTALALDDLYAYEGPLGVTFNAGAPTFTLWAPTATAVRLKIFDAAKAAVTTVALTQDASGVWSSTGEAGWTGGYYLYEVTVYHPASGKVETYDVTDPYAVNLSTNGELAQVVDLADPALKPAGWDTFTKPPLAAPTDIVIYESHLRDFSALDPSVPADRRGKFLAFEPAAGGPLTAGQQHLADLAAAGLTHVHLLPAFDFATVDEDPTHRVDVNQPFADLCAKNTAVPTADCGEFAGKTVLEALGSLAGDSQRQQQIAAWMAPIDAFNWGYDPFHFGALEGSYASTAEGTAKIVEFRRMVMGLASLGLRTVMDVVYNHTNAAGPTSPKSVLDKVVPNYYHRLHPDTGFVETSSCCSNTATEHRMMERLMVDTLVRFARDYKVDGFRFDLMGLHLKANILEAQAALAAVDPSIYLYGEGWNMGEMQNNARGATATQVNMGGTGIGTFNDRIRDAVRGGGPFDSGAALRKNQGFASGAIVAPNELATTAAADVAAYLHTIDWMKIGMAGNLVNFRLKTATDSVTAGGAVGYGGQRTGYALDPAEAINYVSAHDNQTLWDIDAYKHATATSADDRVRMHLLALDTILVGQGIPFLHMGDDLLRSKSMEHDSYDSGDWFNHVDWSGQSNNFEVGLPNAGKDQANWATIAPIFANPAAHVGAAQIAAATAHVQEMLKIRRSSPLFRLRTAADVQARVDFLTYGSTQVPGLVVMSITDGACGAKNLPDLDPARDAVLVVLNADVVPHDVVVASAVGFTLHALQQASADPVVRAATATASANGTTFTVPARTTAVFEALQGATRGAGLPCNAW